MKIRTKFLLSAMTALHLSETNIKRSFSCINYADIPRNKGKITEKCVRYKGGMNIMAEFITDVTCVEYGKQLLVRF